MTAVLLNGASSPADPAYALCTEVERQLAAHFETVRSFHLAGYDIGHCMGEFDCFVKTPGRCRIHDEGQEIERAVQALKKLAREWRIDDLWHGVLLSISTPARRGQGG